MVRQVEENTAKHGVKLFGLDDPAAGHRACGRPGAGPDAAGPADRLRRQPHLDAWRAWRLRVRHRRLRGGACADDADDLAEEAASACASPSMAAPRPGIAAKDIVLAIIAHIGADGATGHAIEFAGSAIRALSIEGRLTLCNMSIEAGARCGMVAPDETTFAYLKGRPYAPKGADFDRAVEEWSCAGDAIATRHSTGRSRSMPTTSRRSSPGARAPRMRCRSMPACPIPRASRTRRARKYLRDALDYMGIAPGQQAHRHRGRSRVHRLLHQLAHRGSARRGRRSRRAAPARCRAWSPPARR